MFQFPNVQDKLAPQIARFFRVLFRLRKPNSVCYKKRNRNLFKLTFDRQNRSRKRHLTEFETNASANIFAIFNENCFCGNAFSQVLCNCFGVPENVAFVTLANDGKIAI